jgi:hypothetical protein
VGVATGVAVINVLGVLVAQPTAATEIVPPVVFGVTDILFEVLVPDQPLGKVQMNVRPVILVTE